MKEAITTCRAELPQRYNSLSPDSPFRQLMSSCYASKSKHEKGRPERQTRATSAITADRICPAILVLPVHCTAYISSDLYA